MYTIFRATNSDGYVERIHEGDYVLLSGGYFERGHYVRSMKKEGPTRIESQESNYKHRRHPRQYEAADEECRYGIDLAFRPVVVTGAPVLVGSVCSSMIETSMERNQTRRLFVDKFYMGK